MQFIGVRPRRLRSKASGEMLKQASLGDIKRELIPRETSHLVVAMRYYPRFLKKELRDEFICALAPVKELLHDFNAAQRRLGNHNQAFPEVDYERRFDLSEAGLNHLKRLASLSKAKDVYLVCICDMGQRCHREMLLLLAKELYACHIGEVFHSYPHFMARSEEFRRL
jgi:uncharacterized protein YeaO (DUF488 family)